MSVNEKIRKIREAKDWSQRVDGGKAEYVAKWLCQV